MIAVADAVVDAVAAVFDILVPMIFCHIGVCGLHNIAQFRHIYDVADG